ncbi:hypothetical protein X731_22815 [Mesorhizobium sp. L2C054A000]|nr:hypothetical protein X731_22815 [Mesorhizobium sp. L2C054A000]
MDNSVHQARWLLLPVFGVAILVMTTGVLLSL